MILVSASSSYYALAVLMREVSYMGYTPHACNLFFLIINAKWSIVFQSVAMTLQ